MLSPETLPPDFGKQVRESLIRSGLSVELLATMIETYVEGVFEGLSAPRFKLEEVKRDLRLDAKILQGFKNGQPLGYHQLMLIDKVLAPTSHKVRASVVTLNQVVSKSIVR